MWRLVSSARRRFWVRSFTASSSNGSVSSGTRIMCRARIAAKVSGDGVPPATTASNSVRGMTRCSPTRLVITTRPAPRSWNRIGSSSHEVI
jgi:hypothetical protein